MKKFIFFNLFLLLMFTSTFGLIIPNNIKWKEIDSKHFTVIYHTSDKVAFRTIDIAESIHKKLHKKFFIPDDIHTFIVIVDSSDIANGVTSILPTNIIILYYTGVESYSETALLNTYNFWEELILHEYTHILHLNQRKDINRILNFLGLKYIVLNPILPAFCIEGTAVAFETEYTKMGRARGHYTEMVLRSAVYENGIPSLDEIAYWNVRKLLPGQGAYIWGGAFSYYLINHYGEDKLLQSYYDNSGCISEVIGYTKNSCSSCLTLSPLNGIFKERFGKELYTLWDEWVLYIKKKYTKIIEDIKSKGITKIKRVSNFYYNIYDLKLYHNMPFFSALSADYGYGIYKGDKLLVRNRFVNSALHFQNRVYFTGYEIYNNSYTFFDIYEFNGYDEIQLTEKSRILRIYRFDKKHLVGVRDADDKKEIVLCDANGKIVRKFMEFDKEVSIGDILHIEDSLYFILRKEDGFVDIYRLNLKNNELASITDNPAIEISLFYEQGDDGFYFVSDYDGIYNLYYYSIEKKKFYKLTNFIRGIFRVYIDDDIYGIAYSSKGYYIGKILKKDLIKEEVKYNEAGNYKNFADNEKIKIQKFKHTEASDYSAMRHIFSTFNYVPYFLYYDKSYYTVGTVITMNDILVHHILVSDIEYTSENEVNFGINYYNYNFVPYFSLYFSKFYESYFGSLHLSLLKEKWKYYFNASAGFISHYYGNFSNAVSLNFRYSSSEKYPYSVSYERGMDASLGIYLYNRAIGSRYNFDTLDFSFTKYFPLFFKHHTLRYHFYSGFLLSNSDVRPYMIWGFTPSKLNLSLGYYLKSYEGEFKEGKNILASSFTYSMPVVWIERGYRLFPVMLEKIWLSYYYEIAGVFNRCPDINDFYDTVGAESHISMRLFYSTSAEIVIGINKPLKRGKEYSIYISVSAGL